MIKGLGRALALSCCALLAMPAFAVTYVIDAFGTGVTSGIDPILTYPAGSYQTPQNSLQIFFVVPDMPDQASALVSNGRGIGFVTAIQSGLNFSFDGTTGRGPERLSGTVCFSNPTGFLPTSQVSLVSGCGGASFSAQEHYSNSVFSGAVINFQVLPGGFPTSLSYGASVFNVPEPSTWALMLVGFGAIGLTFRLRAKALSRVVGV